MPFKKVLLINPPSSAFLGSSRPSLGLAYLGEVLQDNSFEYDVLDMRLYKEKRAINELRDKLSYFDPDLIGFSLYSFEFIKTYELIKRVKSLYPNKSIIVGGPHISTLREEVLNDCASIDYGVVQEGEYSLIELCQGRPFNEIKGLIHREGEHVVYNGDRDYILDLDELPFPSFEKFPLEKYIPEIGLISSRGCPYKCIYCPVKHAIGKRYRTRSAKKIVDEMEYWYKRGYKQFNFLDDNFTLQKKRVYELCDEIEKRRLDGMFLRVSQGVRADSVDRPLLERMREVGFAHLSFGVESGSNKVLKTLKKGEDIETIRETVRNACELGYDVALFFVVGAPGETMSDVQKSIDFAKEFPVLRAQFYNLLPFPKTELYEWIKKNNYFVNNYKSYKDYLNNITKAHINPVFETPELSKETRYDLMKKLGRVETQITRKATARKLKKLFPLNIVIAFFFSLPFFNKILFNNMFVRKIAEIARFKISVNTKSG